MTSIRQIEANRRNAQLSTGPVTEQGKSRSRQNAVRHGLTAETVIDALENVDDYAGFQLAVASDFEAQTAVERELVLRLASVLWRLRRVTSIETGLFQMKARELLRFRGAREDANHHEKGPQDSIDDFKPDQHAVDSDRRLDNVTNAFLRLNELPTSPLDRLSRYEAALWRQACQIKFTLECLGARVPRRRLRW